MALDPSDTEQQFVKLRQEIESTCNARQEKSFKKPILQQFDKLETAWKKHNWQDVRDNATNLKGMLEKNVPGFPQSPDAMAFLVSLQYKTAVKDAGNEPLVGVQNERKANQSKTIHVHVGSASNVKQNQTPEQQPVNPGKVNQSKTINVPGESANSFNQDQTPKQQTVNQGFKSTIDVTSTAMASPSNQTDSSTSDAKNNDEQKDFSKTWSSPISHDDSGGRVNSEGKEILIEEKKKEEEKLQQAEKTCKELGEKVAELEKEKNECEEREKCYQSQLETAREQKQKLDAEKKKLEEENRKLRAENGQLGEKKGLLQSRCDELSNKKQMMKEEIADLKRHLRDTQANLERLFKTSNEEKKQARHTIVEMSDEIRGLNETNTKLKAENTDLSMRYSKLASAQLKDNNPDIVDLNDPNRAMKLAEKFSELYNDTWTDASQAQHDLGIPEKEAIENLLDVLKNSYKFCERLAKEQFDSVSNVLLYPYQDPSQQVSQRGGGLEAPRISSSSKKALIELRRQIASGRVEEIKQAFLSQMHKQAKTDKEKQAMEASKAYYLRCVEICWLMVLHDPPLFMCLDVKPGSKVDLNMYTVLSKGEKVDYLVWPPLLNGSGGGMLQKGVVECVKTMTKKAKTK